MRCAALESLASVLQPEALVRDLHGRLRAAAATAGVPPASAMDLATAATLLGCDAANSFGVRSLLDGWHPARRLQRYHRLAALPKRAAP